MPDLVPWDPWRELVDFRDALEHFWARRFPRRRGEGWFTGGLWSPAVDVYDRGDSIVVKAEIPGVSKDEINLTLTEDGLTISGETRRDEEIKDRDYYRRERSYGSFTRTIPLPVAVQKEGAKATFKDGVLEVTLPKVKGAGPRGTQINIE
ncbi:MAG TPA: Hsp20/alpha crystallin family protein [Firmicutes bacterium]|nr:Hsp20/alpha crystallin family protein [Bacillota bacterium]HHY98012.1 Hsp20/alpha crystallin family protein [Bacillota bacterium]